ncbi:flagellar protein FlaG [Paenibacillus paridis]|uniref:flagellar protein FlaG n=1 Tax=Paenibacillus paridis TaxID=2583376 RepID=UPI00111EEC94|nr:flagellar protein FlaG [Paenibacillus paridis]
MINISSVNTTAAFTSEAKSNIGPRKEIGTDPVAKPVNRDDMGGVTVTEEFVRKSIDKILSAIKSPETTIDRSIHDVTKQVIYKIRDKQSGEIIRQFPEEKLVEAAARLIELTGMVLDKKA